MRLTDGDATDDDLLADAVTLDAKADGATVHDIFYANGATWAEIEVAT